MCRLSAGRLSTHAESPATNGNNSRVFYDVLEFFNCFWNNNLRNHDRINLCDVVDDPLGVSQAGHRSTVVILIIIWRRTWCCTKPVLNSIAPAKPKEKDQYEGAENGNQYDQQPGPASSCVVNSFYSGGCQGPKQERVDDQRRSIREHRDKIEKHIEGRQNKNRRDPICATVNSSSCCEQQVTDGKPVFEGCQGMSGRMGVGKYNDPFITVLPS